MSLRDEIVQAFYRKGECSVIDTDQLIDCEHLADIVMAIPMIGHALNAYQVMIARGTYTPSISTHSDPDVTDFGR